ncbi:MAG: acetyl-CoA carboxylase biotin carboxyl carrier protein subunit [Chloroflexi bacterium]|nr:acetyl-CoA carboxylase biotin carboxyl carrier protein subunit [Chloroflexota bacterium]
MEKYRVIIEGKEFLVEIEGDRVWFDGREVYAGIHFLNDDGLFMIERDEGKREFHIKPRDEDTYQVTTRGLQTEAVVEPEKRRRKKTNEAMDSGLIKAPIPGVVMNVAVSEGDSVESNQVLVVLESMKMLMEFKAPFGGLVEKIHVNKGQNVEKGDEMVKLVAG